MLEARGVVIERNGRRLLDTVTVAAAPSCISVIVGPNGAGKSTLLRVLAGELRPISGATYLNGMDVSTVTAAWLARKRAVVPQSSVMAFPFTALEVVLLGATVPAFATDSRAGRARGRDALQRLGLRGFEGRPYAQLSGGERQRVHIARAVCQLEFAPKAGGEPQALLLDEPTSSQDLGHQRLIIDELRRIAGAGAVVVIVMHDLNLAATVADRVALMRTGRLVGQGSPDTVFTESLLSDAFDCEVAVHRDARLAAPMVLPMPRKRSNPNEEAAE
ncbi:MAG: heme ABC transporter ATP-binding protein [Hyphomicrobium sp.]